MQMFADSFDLYAAVGDMAQGYWDSQAVGSAMTLVAGRFSGSQAVQFNNSNMSITKSSGQNDAVHHLVFAIRQTAGLSGTSTGTYFQLLDGTTGQCCVVLRSDGALLLASGTVTGTTLDTYTGAVTANNAWFAFEIEIVINNTAGSWTVRKNGNTGTPDHTLGSLNTRGGTTNNYANKITVGMGSTAVNAQQVDDLLWRSDPAAVPWVGDVRAYVQMPSSDAQAQFSPNATFSVNNSPSNTSYSNTAGNPHYAPFVPSTDGTVTTVTFNYASTVAMNSKAAVFTSTSPSGGGSPATALATSNVVTNPATGNIVYTFPTPATVTRGQQYFVALCTDTTGGTLNCPGNTTLGWQSTTAYASFPANSPTTTPTYAPVYNSLTIVTTDRYACVSEAQQDGATSYVYSSTVGQNDLYSIAPLPVGSPTIIAVTTRGFMEKSDAGARSGQLQVVSGTVTPVRPNVATGTQSQGAGVMQWISFTASVTGSIGRATISVNAPATAHMKAAIYNQAGTTLLGTSSEVANPTAGGNVVTFSPSVAVTSGTVYQFALDQDASITYNNAVAGPYSWASVAYTSFPPATLTGGSGNSTPTDFTVFIGLSTTVQSTPLVLSTSWLWNWRTDLVDPNTSAAWTAASVNALQIGPVVQA